MNMVAASADRPEAPLFADGFGERVIAADGATGELLQILRLDPALTAVPSFEFALRERTARLANFRHAYYARVRRVDRVPATGGLAIVSDHIEGTRLSDILRVAEQRGLQLDINTALCLIRQLVPAVALLHENARDVAHGLIAPERIVVTPHARLVIVEHVLAAAIEQLQFGRERLWQTFRIAMPPSAGAPRFDHRADVNGIGLVALSLILGRPLRSDEFPHSIAALVHDARERTALGDEQPLSPALRAWLLRTLQLDVRRAFASAPEALAALEQLVGEETGYVAAPIALETVLSRYISALLEPAPAAAASDTPSARVSAAAARATVPAERPIEPGPVAPPHTPAAVPDRSSDPQPTLAPTSTAPAAPIAAPALVQPAPLARTPVPQASAEPERTDEAQAAFDLTTASLSGTPMPPSVIAREISELISLKDLDTPATAGTSALFEDEPETATAEPVADESPAPVRRGPFRSIAAAAGLVVVLGGFASLKYFGGSTPVIAESMGTLIVQSNPSGVQVFVDGVDRGMTPARLSVAAGAHILELRGRGVPRVIPLEVAAGGQVSQYLEFTDTPATGQLHVQSQPAGAKVTVDGVARGVAPVMVSDLMPGEHEVLLQTDAGTARHVVVVQAGSMASIVAQSAATTAEGPVSGWVQVKAPFTIEIYEQGRLLGTTDTDRIMMAAGRHEIEFVNNALGYRATRTVQVLPGKVLPLPVELPNGTVNLNASPWAEVWIDGKRVGETPIGNLAVAIGPHEVVFKHPEYGEKRHAISVTVGAPVRVSVAMK
jgi:serine/threonine protein kinase